MKVVVDADSWHYRVWKWGQDPFVVLDRWNKPTAQQLESREREPQGFCGYFWTIVFSPLALVALVGLTLAGAAVAVGVGVPAGIVYLAYRGGQLTVRTVRRQPKVVRPVSLVASYAAARKKSICPLVEVRR